MLPIERKNKILTWVEQEKTLKITELSNRLNVSEMTVYRDLKPLIEEKKIIKTSNGIALLPANIVSNQTCSYCFKESNTRHSVQLVVMNHQIVHTCCSHCGLLYFEENEDKITQILCKDYLTDTTISGKMATFLIDSDLLLNCCQPQVIPFQSRKQALQFQKGFGGEISSFIEAVFAIKKKMNGDCNCNRN